MALASAARSGVVATTVSFPEDDVSGPGNATSAAVAIWASVMAFISHLVVRICVLHGRRGQTQTATTQSGRCRFPRDGHSCIAAAVWKTRWDTRLDSAIDENDRCVTV